MAQGFKIPSMDEYRAQRPSWTIHRGAPTNGVGLVSVITITFNSATTLTRTIESVVAQSYPNTEYIIVDGGSTDSTLDIIRGYGERISLWLSERDKGISDAFNRGVSLATGEFIAIVNSDDWLSPDNMRYAVETLRASGADFVFGDQRMDHEGKEAFYYRGDPNYAKLILRRMPALNHPTVVVRRQAYERHGLFVKTLRYAMDYELLLRFHLAGLRGVYDPRILGNMALGGVSDRVYLGGLAECREISIAYGQGTITAWSEYAYSSTKARVRRMLEKILPTSAVRWLWQKVNRQFTPNTGDAKSSIQRPS